MEDSNIIIPKQKGQEGGKQTLEMNKEVLDQMQTEINRLTKLSE